MPRFCSAFFTVALAILAVLPAWTADTGATGSSNSKSYTLYPGDLLDVQVYDNPDLTVQIRIPNSGTISFPLIGDVNGLVGRQVEDLGREITRRLEAKYLRQAVVTLTVKEFGPRFAYVMGSVKLPDAVSLNPLSTVTAMQAIGKCGGFGEDANRAAAQVVRDDPQNPGKKISIGLPTSDKVSDLTSDVPLLPNDLVIVSRLDRVYVIGQVTKPGAVNLPSQEVLSVTKAISVAGGFTPFAKQGDVLLMRVGKPIQSINVHSILMGEPGQRDPELQPGDTVYVPESRF